MLDRSVEKILDYWFGPLDNNGFASPDQGKLWFMGGEEADRYIKAEFGPLLDTAMAGGLVQWEEDATSCLALIILLDQFSRNVYRGDAQAFAGDKRAATLSCKAIDKGWHTQLPPSYLVFLYMPLEHSENLEHQNLCVQLFTQTQQALNNELKARFEGFVSSAIEHRDIIKQFGRFPHRNHVLNRRASAEEQAYLAGGAKRFGQ